MLKNYWFFVRQSICSILEFMDAISGWDSKNCITDFKSIGCCELCCEKIFSISMKSSGVSTVNRKGEFFK